MCEANPNCDYEEGYCFCTTITDEELKILYIWRDKDILSLNKIQQQED